MAEMHFAYSVVQAYSVEIRNNIKVTTNSNILKRLIFPTSTEQTGWLCTSAAKELNQGLSWNKSCWWSQRDLNSEITGFQVR